MLNRSSGRFGRMTWTRFFTRPQKPDIQCGKWRNNQYAMAKEDADEFRCHCEGLPDIINLPINSTPEVLSWIPFAQPFTMEELTSTSPPIYQTVRRLRFVFPQHRRSFPGERFGEKKTFFWSALNDCGYGYPVAMGLFVQTGTNSNLLPSKRPRSLSFRAGMTRRARKLRVM
jgi:hypothetical protein